MLHFLHKFISGKGDGGDSSRVKPTNWNAEHDIQTTLTGIVLGRDISGPGDIQELPFKYNPTNGSWDAGGTGAFQPPAGTVAQRPVAPSPGMIRWNIDSNSLEVYGLGGVPNWTMMPPAGSLMGIPAAAIPIGWFACNGQLVSRTANPQLFALIGTAWGVGDGSTTFGVPNYVDCVLVGAGSTYAVNGYRGAFNGNYVIPLPAHQHNIMTQFGTTPAFPQPVAYGLGGSGVGNVLQASVDGAAYGGVDVQGTPGANILVSTEQPGRGINWIIKGG